MPRGPAQAAETIPRLNTAVKMRRIQLFRKPLIIFFLLSAIKDGVLVF
jgi:hypothetical protein